MSQVQTGNMGNTINRVSLHYQPKLIAGPLKMVWGAIGLVGVFMGVIVCFTVIGIPIGFLMCLGGMGMIATARGKQKTICPTCSYKRVYVTKRALNFKCPKCKTFHVVDWE